MNSMNPTECIHSTDKKMREALHIVSNTGLLPSTILAITVALVVAATKLALAAATPTLAVAILIR
jgi:hypothetical protein